MQLSQIPKTPEISRQWALAIDAKLGTRTLSRQVLYMLVLNR
jgi:hypothetical protein